MDHNGVLRLVLLVASILLVVGPVHSCVNFKAEEIGNNNGLFDINLWDNNSQQTVCSLTGYPAHDEVYDLSCDPGVTSTFDRSTGNVYYLTADHGAFNFNAPEDGIVWAVCEYGCTGNECFV